MPFSSSMSILLVCAGLWWASQVVLVVKNLPAHVKDAQDMGLIPGLGRSPGVGNGSPLHYFCLENSMGRGDWQFTVHGAPESQTCLSEWAPSLFVVVSYDPLYFCGVDCNFFFYFWLHWFWLSSFFVLSLAKSLSILSLKKISFYFIELFSCFLHLYHLFLLWSLWFFFPSTNYVVCFFFFL